MGISLRDIRSVIQNGTAMSRILLVIAVALAVSACSKENLVPLDMKLSGVFNYGTVDAQFCLSAPSPAQQKLKYLFIVDHSASNKPGVAVVPGDISNTDPAGARRYGPMINFINNLTPDPSSQTYFGLIDFSDDATQPGTLTGFDASTSDFVQQATTDWIGGGTAAAPSPYDHGFTNYQAALGLALQMIQTDAQMEAVTQSGSIVGVVYQIVFVSDGVPTVPATSGPAGTLYTQQFTADLQPVISQILNLKNDVSVGPYITNISMNTAYYYNTATASDPNAVTLLQQMANAGNGLFIQFASGADIMYQQFAPPSRNVKNELADVFVENENAVWWDNGALMLDTDGDGLPDAIEQQFGSNPNLRDSDGNGVSDLVEYRTKLKPCNDPACAPANRDPYSICAGFSPQTDSNGNVTFASSSNDGLNDCEKFLLGGNPNTFNSNGDLIPDNLALKNNLSIQTNSASVALADPFGDGITNYNKLKYGMPIQVSAKSLTDFTPRTTTLEVSSTPAPGVTCYHLNVQNVSLTGSLNKIKVYMIQNSLAIQDKPFLMTAEKTLDQNLNASFAPGDFK